MSSQSVTCGEDARAPASRSSVLRFPSGASLSRLVLSPKAAIAALALLVFVFTTAGVEAWWDVGQMYHKRFEGHSPRGPHEDYVVFYSAGRLVREGYGNFLYDINSIATTEVESMGRSVGGTGVLAFFNPPFVAAAFVPLSALPIEMATVVIGIVATGLAAAVGLALQRLLRLQGFYQRLLFWLGFLSLSSVSWVVLHGQFSLLLLLGWLFFFVFQMKGRPTLSGASLAILLIKPQMALLPVIVLLWKRQWQALLTFLALGWAFLMVSVAVAGPAVLVDYPRFLLDSAGWENKWGITPGSMYGWNGFLARLVDNNSTGHLMLTWLLDAITVVAALSAFRGEWTPQKPRFLLQAGALVMATLLVNPHLYMQDLSIMALAVAFGAAYAMRANRDVVPWLGLAILVWVAQNRGLWLLDDIGINVLTPAIALVFGSLLFALRRADQPAEATERQFESPPLEAGVKALYVLQGAYVAFIVAFAVTRDTFLMPDVILLFLVAGFVWGRQRLRFLRDFAPFVLLLFSYDAMRGVADDLTGKVHIDYPIQLERLLFFGHVPTQHLQGWMASMYHLHWYDTLTGLMHAIHFVVPLVFAALIWQHRRDQYWRFIITLLLISYAAFVTFMLVPTAPPWWAAREGHLDGVHIVHLSSHTAFLYDKLNPNPVAAMPSLHAAYPWLFFLFALRLWGKRGLPVVLYPLAVFYSSVYLGHHYVVDIIGGVLYASVGYVLVCGPVIGWLRQIARSSSLRWSPTPPIIEGQAAPLAGNMLATATSEGEVVRGNTGGGAVKDAGRATVRPPSILARIPWRRWISLPAAHWELALYGTIIILAAVLRFWDLGARAFHGDEAVHAGFAWQLADGRGYEHTPLTHGPFQFFGTALVFLLFGDSDYTARLLPALFGTALVALPFLFRGHLGRAGALITSLLLAVSPTLLYFSRFARNDIYIAFFTLALIVSIWRYLAQGRRVYLYAAAGLLALSFCTKEVAFILVAIVLVYLEVMLAKELAAQMGARSPSDWLPEAPPQPADGDGRSHYALLGLPERASARAVRKAYFRLVRNRAARTEAERERIDEAYAVLSDHYRRQRYDLTLARSRREDADRGAATPDGRTTSRRALLAQAALLPTAWLLVAFWPLLASLRRHLGLATFPRSGNLMVLIGCLSLPLYAAGIEKLPFVGDRGYDVSSEVLIMRATVLTLIIASFAVGMMWRWRVWMVAAAVFYSVFILLFTSFLTNPDGFWTGIWGSLDYWMGQQYVKLGDQPSYYYFMLLPVYEFLPLVFALGAAVVYALRGGLRHKAVAGGALALVIALALIGDRIPLLGPYRAQAGFIAVIGAMLMLPMDGLTRLLFYWTLSSLFAFTLAGEKMPWLNVHIALPLCILAGRALGGFISSLEVSPQIPPLRKWAPIAGAAVVAGGAVAVLVAAGPRGPEAATGWLLLVVAVVVVFWAGSSLGTRAALRAGGVAVGAVMLVFTARAGILSSWGHPDLLDGGQTLASRDRGDTPVEMLVFVQSSPDIPVIRDAIDGVAAASGLGTQLPIYIDARDSFHWPWAWYLREYEKLAFMETTDQFKPEPGSVVLVGWRDRNRLQMDPVLYGEGVRYHHRWWFPEEYKGLSSAQVLGRLVNPDSWSSWSAYFINREPPAGIPALDALAYFPRDDRYSEVLAAVVHREP